jgi:predicted small secreted protein
MKKCTVLALAMLLPLLSACNTIEGIGEDIQKGGQSLKRAADNNK